jgi:hypothetical protein
MMLRKRLAARVTTTVVKQITTNNYVPHFTSFLFLRLTITFSIHQNQLFSNRVVVPEKADLILEYQFRIFRFNVNVAFRMVIKSLHSRTVGLTLLIGQILLHHLNSCEEKAHICKKKNCIYGTFILIFARVARKCTVFLLLLLYSIKNWLSPESINCFYNECIQIFQYIKFWVFL